MFPFGMRCKITQSFLIVQKNTEICLKNHFTSFRGAFERLKWQFLQVQYSFGEGHDYVTPLGVDVVDEVVGYGHVAC